MSATVEKNAYVWERDGVGGGLSSHSKDISGQKFGLLTANRAVGRSGGHVLWECSCDCGRVKRLASNVLKRSKSCGCQHRWVGHIKRVRRGVDHLETLAAVGNFAPVSAPLTWAIEAGTAGEHIACADLILGGHRAFMTAAGLAYDIIVDTPVGLLKVNVKSTRAPAKRPGRPDARASYRFQVSRNSRNKGGRGRYAVGEVDIVALVALDIRRVAYLPLAQSGAVVEILAEHADPATNVFGPRRGVTKTFAELTFSSALSEIEGSLP